jgi:hypothetical protein
VAGPPAPGEGQVRRFAVGNHPNPLTNPNPVPVDIRLESDVHLPGWEVELVPRFLRGVRPGEARPVTMVVTPAAGLPPAASLPAVDVRAVVASEPAPRLLGGVRLLARPPVPLRRPGDPPYAASEIGVHPHPVLPGRPAQLSVQVVNPGDEDRLVTATFAVAPLGIGLPFSTAHITPNPVRIYLPARGTARGRTTWRAPDWSGPLSVRVTLETEGAAPVWSQRTVDVGGLLRPGEPRSLAVSVGAWPYTAPVTVRLGLVDPRSGWEASLSADEVAVRPGAPASVTLVVTPPLGSELGSGERVVDLEGTVGDELLGGVRVLDRTPLSPPAPHERAYAATEIVLAPDPPEVGQPVRIGVVAHNTCTDVFTLTGRFSWAAFGMGIPFSSAGIEPPETTFTLGPQTTLTPTVAWTPQVGGRVCVRVELVDPQGVYAPQVRQRNVVVAQSPPCGETQAYSFTVRNDSGVAAAVELGVRTVDVPGDWEITTSPASALVLGPREEGVVEARVVVPCAVSAGALLERLRLARLQAEAGGVPTIDVEGYIEGELVGGIELQFAPLEQRVIYLPFLMR